MSNSKAKLRNFDSDSAAEEFVANADLTQFDLSGTVPTRYEF